MEIFKEFHILCNRNFAKPTKDGTIQIRDFIMKHYSEVDTKHQNMLMMSYFMRVTAFFQHTLPRGEDFSKVCWLEIFQVLHEMLKIVKTLETPDSLDFLCNILPLQRKHVKEVVPEDIMIEILNCLMLSFTKFRQDLFELYINTSHKTLTKMSLFLSMTIRNLQRQKNHEQATLGYQFVMLFYKKIIEIADEENRAIIANYVAFTMPQVISTICHSIHDYYQNYETKKNFKPVLYSLDILEIIFVFLFNSDLKNLIIKEEKANEFFMRTDFTKEWFKSTMKKLDSVLISLIGTHLYQSKLVATNDDVRERLFYFSLKMCSIKSEPFQEKMFSTFMKIVFSELKPSKIDKCKELADMRNIEVFKNYVRYEFNDFFMKPREKLIDFESSYVESLEYIEKLIYFTSDEELFQCLQMPQNMKNIFLFLVKSFEFKEKPQISSGNIDWKMFSMLDENAFHKIRRLFEIFCSKLNLKSFIMIHEHLNELLRLSVSDDSVIYVCYLFLLFSPQHDRACVSDLLEKFYDTYYKYEHYELKQAILMDSIYMCYQALILFDRPKYIQKFYERGFAFYVENISLSNKYILKEKALTILKDFEKRYEGLGSSEELAIENVDYVVNSVLVNLNTLLIFQMDPNKSDDFRRDLIRTTNLMSYVFNPNLIKGVKGPKRMKIIHVCIDRLLDIINLGSMMSSSSEYFPHYVKVFKQYISIICTLSLEKPCDPSEESNDPVPIDPELFPQTEDEWKHFRCEYRKKYLTSPVVQSRVGEILHFTINLLADSSISNQMLLLDIPQKALQCLRDYEDIYLPYIYKLMKPLSAIFDRYSDVLWMKAYEVLIYIINLSGDFTRWSFEHHILGKLFFFIDKKLRFLENYERIHGRKYELNTAPELCFLRKLIETLQSLCSTLNLHSDHIMEAIKYEKRYYILYSSDSDQN